MSSPMTSPMTNLESRTDSLSLLEHEVGVLLRRVKRLIGVRARLLHEDLQPTSYLMLTYLAEHGPLRASALAEIFDIDKGAISRQVQHLLDLGLVARTPDPDDGRATLLQVTAETTSRMTDVVEHRRTMLQERLGDWTSDELAHFAADLSRYNGTLNRHQ